MDTGFSYRARTAGRRRLVAATLLVIVLFGVDLLTGGNLSALVRGAVADISLTLRRMDENIAATGYFSSHAALASEVQSLKAQVGTLDEKAALSSALESQVTALAGMAHLAQSAPGITAPIASSFIASPYGTFLIGAGSGDGVSIGSLVLSDLGVVVGIVSDVSARTATVTEIFASGHSLDALLDGASITLKGQGGGNATAEVPHGVAIAVGDAVTAPEYGGRSVGVVGHFTDDPSSAATEVYIGSPVNLASLQYVYVVAAQ